MSGFGFLAADFGLDVGPRPEMFTSGSVLLSSALSAAPSGSAAVVSVLSSADLFSPGLPLPSTFLPSTSAVVAAATSRAGITSPSSAGSGSFTGSAGFFERPGLLCDMLRSRTVGSGTGCKSAPRPERSTSSWSFLACFCKSRERRSSACSWGVLSVPANALRSQTPRNHWPNWKLVRKSRLIKSNAP